jgi:hypothetical protein
MEELIPVGHGDDESEEIQEAERALA